jgi:N-acetylglucosamine-6-phosphate deacetylase
VRLRGGNRLAGSALNMDRAIQNVIQLAGVNLRDAVAMATRNPARVGRIASRQRGLNPGQRADLVRFRYDDARQEIQVIETYFGGRKVYSSTTADSTAS